jgi:hypothetical protein
MKSHIIDGDSPAQRVADRNGNSISQPVNSGPDHKQKQNQENENCKAASGAQFIHFTLNTFSTTPAIVLNGLTSRFETNASGQRNE